jgi:hypothetical protein
MPEQVTSIFNNETDVLDLIIYSIDDVAYPDNIFKCLTVNDIEYTNKDIVIEHNFNTNNINSLIKVTITIENNQAERIKAIFNSVILDRKKIIYDLPDYQALYNEKLYELYFYNPNMNLNYDLPLTNQTLQKVYNQDTNKYVESVDEITVYASEYNQTIYITCNDTENVKWSDINITDTKR